jgi:putative solute:sodium symporter small subunit
MPTDPSPPLNLPVDDVGASVQRQRALLAARNRHWQRTRSLTALLLALWLATSFCSVFFARELAGLTLFGWPLSFYLAAQGAALVYLAILAVYALRMNKFDLRFKRELEPVAPRTVGPRTVGPGDAA